MSSDEDFPDWKVSLVAKYFRSARPVNPAPGPPPRRTAVVSAPEDHRDIGQGMNFSDIKGQTMSVDVASSIGDRPESVTNCCLSTSQGMDFVFVDRGVGSKDGRGLGLGEIKSKSKVVDYEIHSDSEEEENCSENVDEIEKFEGRKNEFEAVKTDVFGEKDKVTSSNSILKEIEVLNKVKILDVEDSSDSDSEILSLKKIKSPPKVARRRRKCPRPLTSLEESAGGNDPRIIVDVIIEDLLGIVVSADPEVIAFEIINKCINEMDAAAEESESSLKFTFGSTDIRFRKNPPLPSPPKKNAVSVVISGPPDHVAAFTDEIKKVQRRTSYDVSSNDPAFVRMDFIFYTERESQKFHDKVERMRKPWDLFRATAMVPEAQLCHKDAPRLSEEELLHIWMENRGNLFRGFEVVLEIVGGGKFFFRFESLVSLNCFLFCAQQRPQLSKAFLGVVRQNTRVYEELELKPKKLRKGKVLYKMPVMFRETSVPSLKELGDKHKFKVFHQNFGRRGRPSSATLEFTSKEDFYRFLVDKDCKKFEKVDFISTK